MAITIRGTVDISKAVNFDDDGPKAEFVLSRGAVIHDETVGDDG